jgi:hypothetical protein
MYIFLVGVILATKKSYDTTQYRLSLTTIVHMTSLLTITLDFVEGIKSWENLQLSPCKEKGKGGFIKKLINFFVI